MSPACSYHFRRYVLKGLRILALALALGIWLATGIGPRLERAVQTLAPESWVGQGILFIGVFHATLSAVEFPFHFLSAYVLEKKYGLSHEGWRRWLADEAKGLLLGALFGFFVLGAFYGMIRASLEPLWLWLSTGWILMACALQIAIPRWVVPLFYPVKVLSDESLRRRLLGFTQRIRLSIREVYEIGLSRKTRKANAAVMGFGADRRIVLGDNLIRDFTPDEIEAVLAHECGHYRMHHTLFHILFQFFFIGVAFVALSAWHHALVGSGSPLGLGEFGRYPALALAGFLFSLGFAPIQNGFSRRLETQADRFALEATESPMAFISAMKKLAQKNLSLMDPHPLVEFLFYGHPSVGRRIRLAEAFQRRSQRDPRIS